MAPVSWFNPAERTLPDPKLCRAVFWTERWAKCLVKNPTGCLYAMPLARMFLCAGPNREDIVAKTQRALEQEQRAA